MRLNAKRLLAPSTNSIGILDCQSYSVSYGSIL